MEERALRRVTRKKKLQKVRTLSHPTSADGEELIERTNENDKNLKERKNELRVFVQVGVIFKSEQSIYVHAHGRP